MLRTLAGKQIEIEVLIEPPEKSPQNNRRSQDRQIESPRNVR